MNNNDTNKERQLAKCPECQFENNTHSQSCSKYVAGKPFEPQEKTYERDFSHAHCWNQNYLPCGIPIPAHLQCCLCDTPYPQEEKKECKHKNRGVCMGCYNENMGNFVEKSSKRISDVINSPHSAPKTLSVEDDWDKKRYSSKDFVKDYCNDHNRTIRWIRGAFYDEQEKLNTILDYMENIERQVREDAIKEYKEEVKKIIEKQIESFLLEDWSGEAEVYAEIARLKDDVINQLNK